MSSSFFSETGLSPSDFAATAEGTSDKPISFFKETGSSPQVYTDVVDAAQAVLAAVAVAETARDTALGYAVRTEDGAEQLYTIRNGPGAPGLEIGLPNDFYIDVTNNALYGPKASNDWGSPTALVGPTGATGATGPAGADGRTIFNGTGAPAPSLGLDGDYYFDITNNNFHGPKAAGAWDAGTFVLGPQGPQGDQGVQGIQGIQGAQGIAGLDGDDGRTILSGTIAPAGGTGTDGDFYIDTAASNLYGPKAAGAWGAATNLIGPQGAQGIQGIQGTQGIQGATGATGSTGATGPAGPSTTTSSIVVNNTAPTIHFQDTDHMSGAIHCNSGYMYIMGTAGANSTALTQHGGQWPFYIHLTNNNAHFGGTITAGGNVAAYSDRRLKDDIEKIDDALAKVTSLNGVTFSTAGERRTGVIAQDVLDVLPEAVRLEENGYYSVAYGNMVGLLIEAIKELKAEVAELRQGAAS
jgi:hypothetical protein